MIPTHLFFRTPLEKPDTFLGVSGLCCLQKSWLVTRCLLDDLELEDVHAEVLLLLRIDAPKDVECPCGVIWYDLSSLLMCEHLGKSRIDADIRNLDNTVMAAALQTDVFALLDAL